VVPGEDLVGTTDMALMAMDLMAWEEVIEEVEDDTAAAQEVKAKARNATAPAPHHQATSTRASMKTTKARMQERPEEKDTNMDIVDLGAVVVVVDVAMDLEEDISGARLPEEDGDAVPTVVLSEGLEEHHLT
jgi:hypothetical protein